MSDNTEITKAIAKLQSTIEQNAKRVEDLLVEVRDLRKRIDAFEKRGDELEAALLDVTASQVVSSTMPPLFAAMVHSIHRGEVVWDAEQHGIGHEVVDGIKTARAKANILGVDIDLMRVVEQSSGRAGYIATRPDGEQLVFRVATQGGRLLAPKELEDAAVALTDDETRRGAAARDARDAARKAEEEAAVRAELQRRGARP